MGRIRKIYDSVHRFIHIDELESDLIKTLPFQRLHYIHQLGVTFFVYPGGTHRRFEHSLGVMELATRIYDEITVTDLQFDQELPKVGSFKHKYWRRILRLAALCHDLGHLPFSHTAEHRLLGEGGHEKWTYKIIDSHYLDPIWTSLQIEAEREGMKVSVKDDVIKISLGEKKYHLLFPNSSYSSWEKVVTSIITGDFFGADRIDYLIRDSQYTGLAYGLFDYHQLIEMLKIIPSIEMDQMLTLGVEENGIESCEGLLLARHYMHKRLYQYASVKAYSFHMARFMEANYQGIDKDLEHYIGMTDNEVLTDLNRASKEKDHPGHFDAKCLYLRQGRFRAIPLISPPNIEDLKMIQKELSIEDQELSWEISKKTPSRLGLSFPILRQDGRVMLGDKLSEISIPIQERSWIFVAPQYEIEMRKLLRDVDELR